jgi:lysophospholipase L1-like esterase
VRALLPALTALLALTACSSGAVPEAAPAQATTSASASAGPAAAAPVESPSAPVTRSERRTRNALFFGDSYFVGGGCSPDRNRDMAAVAGRQLGYRPIVRGFGGTGFVATNPDYDGPDYLTQIARGSIDVPTPSLVVIEGGSNDVGLDLREIRRNARQVLRIAQRKYPRAQLVLVGPMQTYGDFSATDAMVTSLRSLARSMDVPFVNTQRWTYGHDEWLCDDYVHPTYAGHRVLGKKLANALARRGA